MNQVNQSTEHQSVILRFNAATAQIIGDIPRPVTRLIESHLSYTDRSVGFKNKRRRWQENEHKCVYLKGQRFATGLIPKVVEILQANDIEIKLDRQYKIIKPTPRELPSWAYKHQREMVEAGLEFKRCQLEGTTGSGKTYAATFFISQFPSARVLFTVPLKGLLKKSKKVLEDYLGEEVGVVGDNSSKWCRVTVGIINSLSLGRDKYRDELEALDIIVFDECFPAGTHVDGQPIESLRVGDYVTAYNEETDKFENRPVTFLFKKVAKELTRLCIGGREVICTPNHPFYTKRGWIAAANLTAKDEVLRHASARNLRNMQTNVRDKADNYDTEDQGGITSCLLKSLPPKGARSGNYSFMRGVQAAIQGSGKVTKEQLSGEEASVLFKGLLKSSNKQDCKSEHNCYKQEECLSQNEDQQSNVQARGAAEDERLFTSYRTQASDTRRERERLISSSNAPSSIIRNWVVDRVCDQDGHLKEQQSRAPTNLLQSRPGISPAEVSCRSGWNEPLFSREESTRQEERSLSEWIRVDSVEVYEPRSADEPQPCDGGYTVYNIEVEGLHTYTVNEGFVVHNCHRAANSYYISVGEYAINTAYRIGLSGTAFRSNGDDILLEGVMGPVVYRTRTEEIADTGVIMEPLYIQARCQHPERVYEGAQEIKYDTLGNLLAKPIIYYDTDNQKPDRKFVYEVGIAENEERNGMAVEVIKSFLSNPRRTGGALVLVEREAHGLAMEDLCLREGINTVFIWGKTSTKVRESYISKLESGEMEVLIASSILNEGEDIPSLQLGVILGGGSNRRTIIQQVGRLIRSAQDKKFTLIVDFYDEEPFYLRSNSNSRRRYLELCGYKDIRREADLKDVLELVSTIEQSPYYTKKPKRSE